jgi:hypothetical protein
MLSLIKASATWPMLLETVALKNAIDGRSRQKKTTELHLHTRQK